MKLQNNDKSGSEIVKQHIMFTSANRDQKHAELKSEFIAFAMEKLARYDVPKELIFWDELPFGSLKIKKPLFKGAF